MDKFLLTKSNSLLVIIDVQTKFIPHIDKSESMLKNIGILSKAAKELEIPVTVTEQYPQGLGHTDKSILDILPDAKQIRKDTFSCFKEKAFETALKNADRSHIIVTGIESHVCVLQTVLDLLKAGFKVHVVKDAVRSRHSSDRRAALELMREAGAVITCTETVIFQWLERSGTPEFKKIQPLIK